MRSAGPATEPVATTCPSETRSSVPLSVSSVGVATALPSSTRPAPSRAASRRDASSERSSASVSTARRHALSVVRGSIVRGPPSPVRRALRRSSIDSRRYPIAGPPPTRNGSTAITPALRSSPPPPLALAAVHHPAPATTTSPAIASSARRVPRRPARGAAEPGFASPARSAWEKAVTVSNRSAGARCSAFVSARSTPSGTPSRTTRTCGVGAPSRLAMMAAAVRPVNGGSPASIS